MYRYKINIKNMFTENTACRRGPTKFCALRHLLTAPDLDITRDRQMVIGEGEKNQPL